MGSLLLSAGALSAVMAASKAPAPASTASQPVTRSVMNLSSLFHSCAKKPRDIARHSLTQAGLEGS
jgi:hypothetical protein